MITRRGLLTGTMAATFGLSAAGGARAQAYPSKPIKVILPYTAGSPNDVIARVIGPVAVVAAWAVRRRRQPAGRRHRHRTESRHELGARRLHAALHQHTDSRDCAACEQGLHLRPGQRLRTDRGGGEHV